MNNFGENMSSKITFNFEVKRQPTKKGSFPVILRITQDRKHKRSTTSIELARYEDWDSRKQRVKSTASHADALNDELDDIRHQAMDTYREQKAEGCATNASIVRQLQNDTHNVLFVDFCNERLKEQHDLRSFGNAKKYGDLVHKITAFLELNDELDLLITEVDDRFVDRFVCYLKKLPNQRYKDGSTLSVNSIVKLEKVLRAILNVAKDRGLIKENCMDNMEIREQPTTTRHLEDEELRKLQTAQFKLGSGLNNARNLYLFSIYTAGMRLGDVLQLRWNNIQNKSGRMRLVYTMTKNDKPVDIILIEEAVAIISQYKSATTKESDYIFPYLKSDAAYAKYKNHADIKRMPKELHLQLFDAINSKEVFVNKGLKQIADLLGLEPFSFHSSRRDAARLMYDAGVKSLQIQDLLNHHNLSTTERYMRKLDTSATDNALEQTFSQENKDRRARVLVRELKKLGYGKADVKRLFDSEGN